MNKKKKMLEKLVNQFGNLKGLYREYNFKKGKLKEFNVPITYPFGNHYFSCFIGYLNEEFLKERFGELYNNGDISIYEDFEGLTVHSVKGSPLFIRIKELKSANVLIHEITHIVQYLTENLNAKNFELDAYLIGCISEYLLYANGLLKIKNKNKKNLKEGFFIELLNFSRLLFKEGLGDNNWCKSVEEKINNLKY